MTGRRPLIERHVAHVNCAKVLRLAGKLVRRITGPVRPGIPSYGDAVRPRLQVVERPSTGLLARAGSGKAGVPTKALVVVKAPGARVDGRRVVLNLDSRAAVSPVVANEDAGGEASVIREKVSDQLEVPWVEDFYVGTAYRTGSSQDFRQAVAVGIAACDARAASERGVIGHELGKHAEIGRPEDFHMGTDTLSRSGNDLRAAIAVHIARADINGG